MSGKAGAQNTFISGQKFFFTALGGSEFIVEETGTLESMGLSSGM